MSDKVRVELEVNGTRREGLVEPRRTLVGLPPRRPGSRRHARRLRERVLRELQRPARRRDDPLVPDVRGAGRRPLADDGRGSCRRPTARWAACSRRSTTTTASSAASARPRCSSPRTSISRRTRTAAPTSRSGRRSAASSAAARATSTSSSRSAPRPGLPHEHRGAGSERRQGRAGDRGDGDPATLARQEPQPGRGSALSPRPGPLPRRHQAPRDAARGDAPEPARARADRLDRHVEGRGLARASSASSPARTSPSTRRRCRRSAPARSCRT